MEKEKNIMKMENQNLKANIKTEKEMAKEKNIVEMVNYYLKVNIKMEYYYLVLYMMIMVI